MAIKRKGKDQEKNRGSYAEGIKEFSARADAARMSRMQGRSNLTSKDLEPKPSMGAATLKEAPNGKEYMGPAYGEFNPSQPKQQQQVAPKQPRPRPIAGRDDLMSRQRQDTIMRREEEKKKKAQGMGGGSIVGS